jgi:hypothetical protein
MMETYQAESVLSKAKEWTKWLKAMPVIDLGPGIGFKPIPPFAGACARFVAVLLSEPDKTVSVYFDVDGSLGAMEQPYWEIHPNLEGGCSRFLVGEEKEMVAEIRAVLFGKLEADA